MRCTITFGVVYFVWPFGKPAGYWKPLGLKYGFVASSPSSMIRDLHPVAGGCERRPPELVGADLLRAAERPRRVVAHVRPDASTPGMRASLSAAPLGTTTANPFATSR